jgi:hypothetical protein
MIQESLFDLINKCVAIKLPQKWYTDVSLNSFEKKLTKSFFKLTEFNQDY